MNKAKHLLASTPLQVPAAFGQIEAVQACIYTTQNAAGVVSWGLLIWCEAESPNEYLRRLWAFQYPAWATFLAKQSECPNMRPPL